MNISRIIGLLSTLCLSLCQHRIKGFAKYQAEDYYLWLRYERRRLSYKSNIVYQVITSPFGWLITPYGGRYLSTRSCYYSMAFMAAATGTAYLILPAVHIGIHDYSYLSSLHLWKLVHSKFYNFTSMLEYIKDLRNMLSSILFRGKSLRGYVFEFWLSFWLVLPPKTDVAPCQHLFVISAKRHTNTSEVCHHTFEQSTNVFVTSAYFVDIHLCATQIWIGTWKRYTYMYRWQTNGQQSSDSSWIRH